MAGAELGKGRGSGVERLRRDIDSGRTGDKVDYPDPAAAPLGADDEAAGHPVSPDIARRAMRQETGPTEAIAAARTATPAGTPKIRSRSWLYIGLAIIGIVAILLLGQYIP